MKPIKPEKISDYLTAQHIFTAACLCAGLSFLGSAATYAVLHQKLVLRQDFLQVAGLFNRAPPSWVAVTLPKNIGFYASNPTVTLEALGIRLDADGEDGYRQDRNDSHLLVLPHPLGVVDYLKGLLRLDSLTDPQNTLLEFRALSEQKLEANFITRNPGACRLLVLTTLGRRIQGLTLSGPQNLPVKNEPLEVTNASALKPCHYASPAHPVSLAVTLTIGTEKA